jgi:hypothetical protein
MNGKDGGGQIRSISIFIGIIDMLSTLDLWKRVRRVQKCYIDRACREVRGKTGTRSAHLKCKIFCPFKFDILHEFAKMIVFYYKIKKSSIY